MIKKDMYTGEVSETYQSCTVPKLLSNRALCLSKTYSNQSDSYYTYRYVDNNWIFLTNIQARYKGNTYQLMNASYQDVYRDNGQLILERYSSYSKESQGTNELFRAMKPALEDGDTVYVNVRVRGEQGYTNLSLRVNPREWTSR